MLADGDNIGVTPTSIFPCNILGNIQLIYNTISLEIIYIEHEGELVILEHNGHMGISLNMHLTIYC